MYLRLGFFRFLVLPTLYIALAGVVIAVNIHDTQAASCTNPPTSVACPGEDSQMSLLQTQCHDYVFGYPTYSWNLCTGSTVYTQDGISTTAGPPGFETSQGRGASGYECWEFAERVWYKRFGIDMNSFGGGHLAQNLCPGGSTVLPGTVTRHPITPGVGAADGYTPVCGDLVAYDPDGANGGPGGHVAVISGVNSNGTLTILNQNCDCTDGYSANVPKDGDQGDSNGPACAFFHANNNTSCGNACSTNITSSSNLSNITAEPYALSAFNTGLATATDTWGDINVLARAGDISQTNDDNGGVTTWQWDDIGDSNNAHDPVLLQEQNGMLVFYYIADDSTIWHDYQAIIPSKPISPNKGCYSNEGSMGNVTPGCAGIPNAGNGPNMFDPIFTGAIPLYTAYTYAGAACGNNCMGPRWDPTLQAMPNGVSFVSNLAAALGPAGIIHIVFFGSTAGGNTTNIYETYQAAANDEFYPIPAGPSPAPQTNLYTQITPIVTGGAPGTTNIPTGHPTLIKANGKLHLFYRSDEVDPTTNNRGFIYHYYSSGNGGWTGGKIVGAGAVPPIITSNVSAVLNHDNRLELFYRGSDQQLWHIWETAAGSNSWSIPKQLGDVLTGDPTAEVALASGSPLIQVMYRDSNGDLVTTYRTAVSGASTVPYAGTWGCHNNLSNSSSSFAVPTVGAPASSSNCASVSANPTMNLPTNSYGNYTGNLGGSIGPITVPGYANYTSAGGNSAHTPSAGFVNSEIAIGMNRNGSNPTSNGMMEVFFVGPAPSYNIWHMWNDLVGYNQCPIVQPANPPQTPGPAFAAANQTGWIGRNYNCVGCYLQNTCDNSQITPSSSSGGSFNTPLQIPFPQSIGGMEVEATSNYGNNAASTPVSDIDPALDALIASHEGIVPYCYGDNSDGMPWPSAGNLTFGVGTYSAVNPYGTGQPPAGGWASTPCGEYPCNICSPVDNPTPPQSVEFHGWGCQTQAQDTQAMNCAVYLLNNYLQGEQTTLFGAGGLVHNPSQLNQCQQVALLDIGYQYGTGGACLNNVISQVNAGSMGGAYNAIMTCPYTARAQNDQKVWNASPPDCGQDTSLFAGSSSSGSSGGSSSSGSGGSSSGSSSGAACSSSGSSSSSSSSSGSSSGPSR